MDKSDLPESFGVFKPVGHTLIAFATEEEMQFAAGRLLAQGFEEGAFKRYTPEQMVAQVDAQMLAASPLASVGQELNLIQAHRALAERGCSFLLVHAPDDTQAGQVAQVARTGNAVAAQRYGRFLIEELIDTPAASAQVFESPDRGLDLPVTDGAPR
jgi:hypothetical protein